MADIFIIKAIGSGWQGAPGLTQFVFDTDPLLTRRLNADSALRLVSDFYETMASYLVDDSVWAPSAEVDFFDDVSGTLQEKYFSGEPITAVAGTDVTSGNSRATMVASKLVTDTVRGQTLLRGRHFIGPIGDSGITSEGQLTEAIKQSVATAYAGMIDVVGPNLGVWGRPVTKIPEPFKPGVFGRATGAGVSMDVPAVLRSRRD